MNIERSTGDKLFIARAEIRELTEERDRLKGEVAILRKELDGARDRIAELKKEERVWHRLDAALKVKI